MRILVVGAGATGGYFGARLAQAGRDVTFLVRPARAQRLRADGLQILSPHGDLRLEPALVTSAELQPDYDLIILGVKAYALDSAIDDFAAGVGDRTMVLPFLNGMRHIDALTARFGEAPILGGVCMVSTQLDEDGRIVQLSGMQDIVYGERAGGTSERIAALDALLQGAGFGARASIDIVAEIWAKWVGLSALGAITSLMRGNVGEIEAVPGGADLARRMLDECNAVAAAAGYPTAAEPLARMQAMLTTPASPLASSMYRDLQQGRPIEADQIVGDLLARARRATLTVPLLEAAYVNLLVYSAAQSREPAPSPSPALR